MDSIDAISKSCVKNLESFKQQDKDEELFYKDLSDLTLYNQANNIFLDEFRSTSLQVCLNIFRSCWRP